MAEAGGPLEMLLNPLSLHSFSLLPRPLVHLRHRSLYSSRATIFCSVSDTNEPDQRISQAASKPVTRSSRGRTRQSLGLDKIKPKNPSTLQPSRESASESHPSEERKSNASSPLSAKRESDAAGAALPRHNINSKGYGQMQDMASDTEDSGATSFMEWAKKNTPAADWSEDRIPNTANSKEFSKRIQDLINADLDRKYKSDEEDGDDDGDDDYPLFVDEEDPYWLDEPDEGWGYKVSDLFKENFEIKKVKKDGDDDDDVSDVPDIQWDLEPEKWSAKDVDSMSWTDTVFADPSPLVAILYERYGKKGRECYHMLRELEDAANRIWESNRLPPRLVKINVSFEVDLTAALQVKEVPMLLFIRGGKLLHRQSGYHTADDLLRMISYFYHGAGRPACLKNVQAAKNVSSTL